MHEPNPSLEVSGARAGPLSAGAERALTCVAPAQVRVRFADTDAMGVVYYGTYLSFFEAGRVEAMRQVGFVYAALVEQGLHSPVVEAFVRYLAPARFDDLLLVSAHIADVRPASFRFAYTIQRASDQVQVASGHTVHACVDAHTLRPVRLPAWLKQALEHLRP
jgi:acyl-CoA thioester hydrolase